MNGSIVEWDKKIGVIYRQEQITKQKKQWGIRLRNKMVKILDINFFAI